LQAWRAQDEGGWQDPVILPSFFFEANFAHPASFVTMLSMRRNVFAWQMAVLTFSENISSSHKSRFSDRF
jgi:hypothetical protein